MPRLRPSILHATNAKSPSLRLLLPCLRTVASARRELGWIRDAVASKRAPSSPGGAGGAKRKAGRRGGYVRRLCARRGSGEPLQYVLGSEPFGPLEILCKRGVFIPRQETESSAYHLAQKLQSLFPSSWTSSPTTGKALKIIDLCTGTGCVPLLLTHLVAHPLSPLSANKPIPIHSITGIDISPHAISLANQNLVHNANYVSCYPLSSNPPQIPTKIEFLLQDIFSPSFPAKLQALVSRPSGGSSPDVGSAANMTVSSSWTVITANPPYISARGFATVTARSVRKWEPKLALVPDVAGRSARMHKNDSTNVLLPPTEPLPPEKAENAAAEDIFYVQILSLVSSLHPPPRVLFFEVGDISQAVRVADMALLLLYENKNESGSSRGRYEVEIWRDFPEASPGDGEDTSVVVRGHNVKIAGTGEGRSVFLFHQH